MIKRVLKWVIGDEPSDVARILALVWLMIAIGLLALLIPAFAQSSLRGWPAGLTLLGAGLFLAGSSTVTGSLVGFLFGVPRDPNLYRRAEATIEGKAGSTPNTNLERISDWLTSMLVGVGLTQLPEIGHFFGNLGRKWASAFGGTAAGEVIAISISVHYLLMGFFQGFLLASLWLPGAMARARKGLDHDSPNAQPKEPLQHP